MNKAQTKKTKEQTRTNNQSINQSINRMGATTSAGPLGHTSGGLLFAPARQYVEHSYSSSVVELRADSLPLNYRFVHGNPGRFGQIKHHNNGESTDLILFRTMTEMTMSEREFMRECEASHRTDDTHYHNVSNPKMVRCPYTSCRHTIINSEDLSRSAVAHLDAFHHESKTQYTIFFQ